MFTPPLRELTAETSLGFAVVEFAETVLGISLFPWQKWLLVHALELLDDGTFRFRTVVVLVARQNGKSTLAQVLSLFFLYVRGAKLVIGTAQNLDIAEEVWEGAVEIAEETDVLAAEIAKVNRTNGKKALVLESRARYKVQAANRRGGRGLAGDLILLDELREHQSWQAWSAITKTTMARPFAQVWALSNAGDVTSLPLRHLRLTAHRALGDPDGLDRQLEMLAAQLDVDGEGGVESGDAETAAVGLLGDQDSIGLFEWSAEPHCPLDDRAGWAQANPSLGWTITERTIAAALATDPEPEFRTEVLCQWVDSAVEGAFPPGSWAAGVDPASVIPDDESVWFGVDVSADRSRSHISVAGRRDDGDWHVEVVASRAGTEWVTGWFTDRASLEFPMVVALQGRGAPVSSLIDDLESVDGLTVVRVQGADLAASCGRLFDMVAAHLRDDDGLPRAWHRGQPALDAAAEVAATKPLGDGAWVWDRVRSPLDCAQLMAVTVALWAATQRDDEEPQGRSAYEDRNLVVV